MQRTSLVKTTSCVGIVYHNFLRFTDHFKFSLQIAPALMKMSVKEKSVAKY